MNGATVYMRCHAKDVGLLLHMLEDAADVFVVGRDVIDSRTTQFQLRSDRFPAEWNGMEVGAVTEGGILTHFTPVVRP